MPDYRGEIPVTVVTVDAGRSTLHAIVDVVSHAMVIKTLCVVEYN